MEGAMSRRQKMFVMAVALLLVMTPFAAFSQSPNASGTRTAWGDPDLQGVWTSSTYTPLERPENLGDQAFLSEEELASLNELLTEEGVDPLRARSVLAADSEEERIERTRQTFTTTIQSGYEKNNPVD